MEYKGTMTLWQLIMYVTGREMRGSPHKLYIFLISINSRIDMALFVCPYENIDLRKQRNLRLIEKILKMFLYCT